MKRTYIFMAVVLFALAFSGCDKDECPKCHECECIC